MMSTSSTLGQARLVSREAAKPRRAIDAAYRWFLDHGGDGAVARTRAGGMQFLFQGEIAPFTVGTVKQLIEAGLAEYYGSLPTKRLRVFAASREPSSLAQS